MREGKIIKATGYGLATVETKVPIAPESIFQSGSTGIQVKAPAVIMLVEDGEVGLGDRITKYFPEAPTAWKAVAMDAPVYLRLESREVVQYRNYWPASFF
jgi:CubicO group peptidase (beta-lactamase class C family)